LKLCPNYNQSSIYIQFKDLADTLQKQMVQEFLYHPVVVQKRVKQALIPRLPKFSIYIVTYFFAGHTKTVKLLLDRGALVNGGASETTATETPLHVAAAAGHMKVVELLMSFGASPFTAAARDDMTPIATSGCLSAVASE
jgi:hypothetical protein